MVRSDTSPMQLAVRTIGGATLAVGGFFLMLPHWGGWLLRLFLFFVPFACGLWISWAAENRLKREVKDAVWTEVELTPVRILVENPIWTWVGVFALVLMVLGFAFPSIPFMRHLAQGIFYVVLLPCSAAMRLRRIVAPPVVGKGGLMDWHSFKPIRSEHWGEA